MRKLFVIPLIALAAVAFASGPVGAPAVAAMTCDSQFDLIRADTQSVAITASKAEREQAGLLKLVEDAGALAALGKTSDASKKLLDYVVKVDQLEAAGRIDSVSADRLRGEAEAAIACLQSPSA